GLYARTALVSDVELVDDYPGSVVAHAQRLHRWVRGDWQILFWLLPWVRTRAGMERNTLPLISRFKIFDNLRRSLAAPATLAFLTGAWTFFPGSPLRWTALAVAIMALPVFLVLIDALRGRGQETAKVFAGRLIGDLRTALARFLITLTFLAYRAADMLHAIALTLVRLCITQRRLLEWETAAAAARKAAGLGGLTGMRTFVLAMAVSPAIALAASAAVAGTRPDRLVTALPFLLLWAAAPGLAYLLSRPVPSPVEEIRESDRALFGRLCRRSWRYFEELAGAEDHGLPPDNFQETPGPMTAHRTSPTNIGLGLLATLAAHDLGYVDTDELVDRVDKTLTTVESLEKHQGHLLNWYDTRTLAPLAPRYVSTVDSGNLAGALVVLAQSLRAPLEAEAYPPRRVAGLATTMDVLGETLQSHGGTAPATALLRQALADWRPQAAQAQAGVLSHRSLLREVADGLRLGADAWHDESPEGREVAFWARAAAVQAERCAEATAPVSPDTLRSLAERASSLAEAMDFGFLYDRQRKLFAIGYRLADAEGPGRLDESSYDLLASEARLASFWAIAKEDVPQEHWFHLGRPLTSVDGQAALLSWSATLFEYLMPMLLMRSYPDTLLDRACRLAVRRQQQYGAARRVPWGISESAFAVTDRQGHYQYKAFGVPGLGLKRGLGDELVVAPYATALAAMVAPAAAAQNLARLVERGLLGRYGLYEAIDFTPRSDDPRASRGKDGGTIVRAHLAHHQAMTLVALANVLDGQAMVRRFHADPRVQATELLLQERVPRGAPIQ
ncbi:MAG TPA: glucoamylase family protein, partial [Vicinamibacteria bacterium]